MAEIITTIGLRAAENVTVDSVTGSDPYTVTLSAATSSTDVGDSLQDEHTSPRSYLITAGVGTDTLTVSDSTGAGAPDSSGTSQATTTRYYSTVSGWDSGMVAGDLYSGTGDDATAHLMNDGPITEDNLLISSSAVGSVSLTAPAGERHDGTPGTGARISANSTATRIVQTNSNFLNNIAEVSWIELDGSGETIENGLEQKRNLTSPPEYRHLLVYDGGARWGGGAIIQKAGTGGSLRCTRCMVWNWSHTSGLSGGNLYGISADNASSSRLGEIHNCTVWSITHTHAARDGYGISTGDHSNKVVKNNGIFDCDIGLDLDAPGLANYDYNCTSDATSSGANSLASKTAANNFVSTSPVDLHLKAAADCIDAGLDLNTTPAAVEIDIDGRDLDAEADVWDIGCDEFVAVAAFRAAWARCANMLIGSKIGD